MRFVRDMATKGEGSRQRRKFLWLPLRIGREARWLELAVWREEPIVNVDRFGNQWWGWRPVAWESP